MNKPIIEPLIAIKLVPAWLAKNLGTTWTLKTIYNWMNRDESVSKRLETVKLGRVSYTTKTWIMEFLEGKKC